MKLAAAILVIAIVVGGAYAAVSYYWLSPTEKFAPPRELTIEKGESFRQIARALADAGVVRSALAIRLYGQMSQTARQIKPGDYAFNGGERIPDVMRHLVRGDFVVVTVTIPEGLTVHQIAERLARDGPGLRGRIRAGRARGRDGAGAGADAARRGRLPVPGDVQIFAAREDQRRAGGDARAVLPGADAGGGRADVRGRAWMRGGWSRWPRSSRRKRKRPASGR